MKTVSATSWSRKSQLRALCGFLFLLPFVLSVTFVVTGLLPTRLIEFDKPSRLLPNDQSVLYPSLASERRCPRFPYSVVPGGVHDAEELAGAVKDPVVARHYSDFCLSAAHAVRLDRPTPLYVSYRIDNQVYWTRGRVLIPAGEALISDGQNLLRERCGNRLSPFPRLPVLASEPPQEQLENADFVPPLLAGLAPADSSDPLRQPITGLPYGPVVPSSGNGFPVVVLPPVKPGPSPLRPVPEPGSRILLFGGALFCGLLFASLSRNRPPSGFHRD